MEGVTAGRMTHFVTEDGRHVAAIVAEVLEPRGPHSPRVSLFVVDPQQGRGYFADATYSEHHEPGSWHWIERA